MNEERQRHYRGHLGRGMFLSLLAHGSVIFPFVVLAIIFARREVDQRDLDVRFEEVSEAELPDNLPELDRDVTPSDRMAQRDDPEVEAPLPDKLPAPPEKEPE